MRRLKNTSRISIVGTLECSRLILILLLVSFFFNVQVYGQLTYVIDGSLNLKVRGTSTIHDWEMVSNNATGTAKLLVEDSNLISINSLNVTMPIHSLKSGKGGMDTNAYKALKSNEHPFIVFELTGIEKISEHQLNATGTLAISGAKRNAAIEVNYEVTNEKIQFSGAHAIKFSEFNIDPPTAVFGTIRTGDDLTLSFNISFQSTTKITKQ